MSTATYGQISNSLIIKSINVMLKNGFRNHETVVKQETQLSLANRATHLYKCSDVADLTSVINIRLEKNLMPRIRPFKVTQGHWNRQGWSAIYFYNNYVPKTHRFEIFDLKCCYLEIRVRDPSRSLNESPFDRVYVTFYWRLTVNMALSHVVSEIFNVEKCRP